jgi:predicted dehydrogenase
MRSDRASEPLSARHVASPLKLGVVGFGKLAQEYYVPAIRRLPVVRLSAVADPLIPRLALARGRIAGVQAYTDHRAMLDAESLDAVLIASPPSTHRRIWMDVVASGLPAFVEKPFLVNGDWVGLTVTPEMRRRTIVNFNRRRWPPLQRLASLLHDGAIGQVRAARFVLHVDVLRWCTITDHRLSSGEGGVLHDLGSQVLDMVRHVFGDRSATVRAESRSVKWPDDRILIDVDIESGATVHCDLAYADRTRERIIIEGSDGRIRLDDPNMGVHVMRHPADGRRLRQRLTDAAYLGYRAIRRDASMLRCTIRESIGAFARALQTGSSFSPGFGDAVVNAAWLDAVSKSLVEKRPVPLHAVVREWTDAWNVQT